MKKMICVMTMMCDFNEDDVKARYPLYENLTVSAKENLIMKFVETLFDGNPYVTLVDVHYDGDEDETFEELYNVKESGDSGVMKFSHCFIVKAEFTDNDVMSRYPEYSTSDKQARKKLISKFLKSIYNKTPYIRDVDVNVKEKVKVDGKLSWGELMK